MPERYIFPEAPYLGVFDQKMCALLGGIIESNTIYSLEWRVKTESKGPFTPLPQLALAIADNRTDFIEFPNYTLLQYAEPYQHAWEALKIAANSLICEQYLKANKVSETSRLITSRELEFSVRSLPPRTLRRLRIDASASPARITTPGDGTFPLTLTDSFLATKTGENRAMVGDYFIYRIFTAPFNVSSQITHLRKVVNQPNSREALQMAINLILFGENSINPKETVLLSPDKQQPKLVTSYPKESEDQLREHFSGVYCAQIPEEVNINLISLFFLEAYTRGIPYQENWQDYFRQIQLPVQRSGFDLRRLFRWPPRLPF